VYIIRGGDIYEVKDGREIEFVSPFAQEYFDQERDSWDRGAWKRGGTDDGAMISRGMLWGTRAQAAAPRPPQATQLFQRGRRLYYVLRMSNSSGLFYYDLDAGTEMRLFHRADFEPRGLFVRDDYSILTTVSDPDGSVHIVLLDAAGKLLQTLTSGDCIDENPFQVSDLLYYQSSGIARAETGQVAAISPIAIHTLDLGNGEIATVLSSPQHDFLLPKVGSDGGLYAIQTTYTAADQYPVSRLIMDIVLFPWRICVAIFGFLNVFSLFFGKKPLKTGGGPEIPPVDVSRRMVHNRLIDLTIAQRKERKKAAVSRDWKLVKLRDGVNSVVATNVLWFSVKEDGGVVYTNGFSLRDDSGGGEYDSEGLVTAVALQAGE